MITDQPIEFVGVPTEWTDENPYYLHIVRQNAAEQIIDLGESGWMKTYAEWMRGRSRWYLVRKQDNFPVLVVDVGDNDQPYYAAHHVGKIGSGGSNQITAYGIGAKRWGWSLNCKHGKYAEDEIGFLVHAQKCNQAAALAVKILKDRNADNLWILPGGMVCAGDDVDGLGIAIVEALGPQ